MPDDDRIDAYADALLKVSEVEGNLDEVSDELFRFGRILEGSDELRQALADPHLPAIRRQQIVEDLLREKASPVTTALVSMVTGTGRAHDLPRIIDEVVTRSAAARHREVAEVRSAVDLTDDQKQRLAEALQQATGTPVDVKVVIDPTVLGGLVCQVGDTIIDGSVRHRLNRLREAL
jgi:F-type H+-transporting ATPase subunit delta